jgi:diamine N-acetyltransferase
MYFKKNYGGCMIQLRPIMVKDIEEIKNWPTYSDGFEEMDYALRNDGWIDEFRKKPKSWMYIAEFKQAHIGFSLLSLTEDREAEFRIAIHPDWTNKGLGKLVALATLEKGFRQLNLEKIYLIVRKSNHRASRLYRNIGFSAIGESVHTIQGKPIEFIDMIMTKEDFNNLKFVENA